MINQYLSGLDCTCGRQHRCDVRFVAIEHDAITRHLARQCNDFQKILLVADENTFGAAGAKVEAALKGKTCSKLIFDGSSFLIPNETAVARVQQELPGHDLIIGIGSGVIQDLCKYVSFESGIPYYVVATAPSMDGYTSNGAAMIMYGMKVTYACGLPAVILADTEILKDAPFNMIQAGYGDIVGKYSALNDWKLSRAVNGEYFCQKIYDMTMDSLERTLSVAEGLVRRDEESVRILMEALIFVGIAMSFAGSSRPASGSEHHLSHYFEIVGIERGEPYFPHGIDVAFSTIIMAKIREEILSKPFPNSLFRQPREEYEAEIKRVYGCSAEGCIALQDKVGNYAANRLPVYLEKEAEIRSILREMPGAQEIERMLAAVGYDMADFYNLYDAQKIKDAIPYAKELKDRYTVLWLYYDLFGIKD